MAENTQGGNENDGTQTAGATPPGSAPSVVESSVTGAGAAPGSEGASGGGGSQALTGGPVVTSDPVKIAITEEQDKTGPKSSFGGQTFSQDQLRSEVYAPIQIERWRSETTFSVGGPIPPRAPQIFILKSADIRPIAAYLRQATEGHDVALDLELEGHRSEHDGRSLREILRSHRTKIASGARLAFHRGGLANGLEYWSTLGRDAMAVRRICEASNISLFVACVGAVQAAHLREVPQLDVIEVDEWPLIEALAAQIPGATTEMQRARQVVEEGYLTKEDLIASFLYMDLKSIAETIDNAREKDPFVSEARRYIVDHVLDDAMKEGELARRAPADIAASLTSVCFGELSPQEFNVIAKDIVETPDLVEPPPPPKKDEPPIQLRTQINERALINAGVDVRQRRGADGSRSQVLVLRGTERKLRTYRQQLPEVLPLKTTQLVRQMSARLVHGAVQPNHWASGAEVVAQVLLNEVGGSPQALGGRLADYWFAENGQPPAYEPDRARNLAKDGERLLTELCERAVEVGGMDLRKLQVETAIALAGHGAAASVVTAWHTPAAADFISRLLCTAQSTAEVDSLLSACLRGPDELCALLWCSLVGGFAYVARSKGNVGQLDTLLAAFAELARTTDPGKSEVRDWSRAIVGPLAALRLGADLKRLAAGDPPTLSDALAGSLLLTAAALVQSEEILVPWDTRWLDTDIYDHLAEGWRPPPLYIDTDSGVRVGMVVAEQAHQTAMNLFEVMTNAEVLGDLKPQAFTRFLSETGVGHETDIHAAGLWVPPEYRDGPQPLDGGRQLPDTALARLSPAEAGDDADIFQPVMAGLRRSALVLVVVLGQTALVADGAQAAKHDLAPAVRQAKLDAESMSALSEGVQAASAVLTELYSRWLNAIGGLPYRASVQEAVDAISLYQQIFADWWMALTEACEQSGG